MHITNVQRYAKLIALEYGYPENQAEILGEAAALHDIGKTMVPSAILNKPSKLTEQEFEIMKTHTIEGAKLIESFCNPNENDPMAIIAYDIALHHHERWDGNGYPDKLAGEDISIAAQIVGIADCFDALVSKRCYKDAMSKEVARHMIINDKCGVFAPKIKSVFMKFCKKIDINEVEENDAK